MINTTIHASGCRNKARLIVRNIELYELSALPEGTPNMFTASIPGFLCDSCNNIFRSDITLYAYNVMDTIYVDRTRPFYSWLKVLLREDRATSDDTICADNPY